jgi:hypothetical protein
MSYARRSLPYRPGRRKASREGQCRHSLTLPPVARWRMHKRSEQLRNVWCAIVLVVGSPDGPSFRLFPLSFPVAWFLLLPIIKLSMQGCILIKGARDCMVINQAASREPRVYFRIRVSTHVIVGCTALVKLFQKHGIWSEGAICLYVQFQSR